MDPFTTMTSQESKQVLHVLFVRCQHRGKMKAQLRMESDGKMVCCITVRATNSDCGDFFFPKTVIIIVESQRLMHLRTANDWNNFRFY